MALNPMCHSPVQLAALMSPNKPKVSANQTRIRQLEKGVTKYEDSISEAEDLLAESLNPDKLGDSEYNVASDIRDYIEDEQNGWPCADPSSLLYFKELFYSYGNLLEGILPYAYAETVEVQGCTEEQKSNGKCPTPTGGTGANTFNLWQQASPETQCTDRPGGKWTLEKSTTSTPEGTKETIECICDTSQYIQEGDTCREKNEKDACKAKPGSWTWVIKQKMDPVCECLAPNVIDGNTCRAKNQEEKCKEKLGDNGIWGETGCVCKAPYIKDGNTCQKKSEGKNAEEECKAKPGSWTFTVGKGGPNCFCKPPKTPVGEECRIQEQEITIVEKPEPEQPEEPEEPEAPSDCPDWKQDPSFKSKGRVEGKFCDNFAKDIRKCKESLSKMQRLAKTLNKYRDRLERAEEASEQEDPSETEAGGLCFDCLKRELQANRPSPGQNLGNFLSLLTGTGMTYLGHKMGQTAQMDTNMLRIQQGYPVQQNYFALNGASAGFPFLSNGLYGLTRTNTPTGGWACSPSVSPYGGAYNYGMNYGYSMPYF